MNRELLSLALIAALLPATGLAQEPLSLAAALERARVSNPDIKALRERASAAVSRAEATRKQRLPRVGIDLSAQRTDNAAAVFASRLNASEFGAQDFEIARLNSPKALSHLGSPCSLRPRSTFSVASARRRRAGRGPSRLRPESPRGRIGAAISGDRGLLRACPPPLAATESSGGAVARGDHTARFDEGVALQSDVLGCARKWAREADIAAQRAELAVAEAMLARLIGGRPSRASN
jgi:hypothetical protein